MEEPLASQVRQELASTWIPSLPAGWRHAYLFYSSFAMVLELWCEVEHQDGTRGRVPVPNAVARGLGRMHRRAATPEGSWISLSVEATPDGAMQLDDNWDRRVYWGDHPGAPWEPPASGEIRPDDETYRSSFLNWGYNRSDATWPAWLPKPEHDRSPAERLRQAIGEGNPQAAPTEWIVPALADPALSALATRAAEAVDASIAGIDSHTEVDNLLGEDAVFDESLRPFTLGTLVDQSVAPIVDELSRLSAADLEREWSRLTALTTVPDSAINDYDDPAWRERVMRNELIAFVTAAASDQAHRRFGYEPDWR